MALLLVLGACSDRGDPVAAPPPETTAPQPLLAMSVLCQANRVAATVRCGGTDPTGSARGAILVGGQGVYVQLTSSNVTYDSQSGIFAFDVTVQNLIPQAMGTTDGVTADPAGVRVFFASGPTTTGGPGNVAVANADGMGTFTNTNQKYFEYSGALNGADGILSTNETTGAKNWQLSLDPGVTAFTFVVYVAAEVQKPNGWIDVTPATQDLLQGNTQALTATVRTAVGNVVPGATVAWGTTDGSVITVDGSGVATGAGVGTANVTATSGPRSGSAQLNVCPNLAVGGAYSGVMPGAASLCLGGGGADQEFTYMPVNLSSASALSLTLTATGIQGVTGPPSPNKLPAGPVLGRSAASEPGIDEGFRARLLENDRDLGREMFRKGNYLVQRRSPSGRGPRRLITTGVPSLGDLMNLNVAQGCSGALDTRVGQVRSIGQHVIVVSDTANPPGGFTTAQYDSIALEFDSLAYAVDTTNFGGPTDLDTNQRVVAFYTRAVNELSPPASSVVVLGYFTARDLFSSAPTSCPRSNQGEMFYMLVPDPTGVVNSNVRTVSFVRGSTVGTMAHELQHLINGSRRVYLNGTWSGLFEEVWLNEGLSHVAEELVFYRASGMSPRVNIQLGTNAVNGVQANVRRINAFNNYANPNFGRWKGWLNRPDTSGPVKNVDALASRGATWSFLRYSADRLNGVEAAFWSSLVNTQATGVTNLTSAIGGADVDDWVRDWTAATYADDAVSGMATQYTHPSWNFRSLYGALYSGYANVLIPRPLSNGVGLTLSYSRGGGTAYARFGVPASGFAHVTALSGGVPPTSPYALIVMRTK
ncbi:MAG TPA: Ig-like domain-containing protein [Longimicrobiaceae bacterium]|nr:Ig-like domain-containing protein [Longimicrobiaceae bacterium]